MTPDSCILVHDLSITSAANLALCGPPNRPLGPLAHLVGGNMVSGASFLVEIDLLCEYHPKHVGLKNVCVRGQQHTIARK